MLFFGGLADKWGIRPTFLISLGIMFVGRVVLAGAPGLGLASGGLLTALNGAAFVGILFIVLGYGMYQPVAYAAVRQITTPATAGMAYAMLYAVMNLGGWLPSFMSPIRERFEIRGAFGFYTLVTLAGMGLLAVMLNRRTVERAVAEARAASALDRPESTEAERAQRAAEDAARAVPTHLWVCLALLVLCVLALPAGRPRLWTWGVEALLVAGFCVLPGASRRRVLAWLANHPLSDLKFFAFIFVLIPVQTLFAYNWLVLPQYVNRAFAGSWVGARFETATNLNSLLIFILCPLVAAATTRAKVYNMMIYGTAVMAAPAFFLALGPTVGGLFGYVLVMSVGEAMWQPRFLQYAAEIAPEGRTGAYMGVAQFPWFLTKMLVPVYSGAALARWCPAVGPTATGPMWLIFGLVAMSSTVLLILAKGWLGKDFKTKA
jgi:proton-dependent oligopeptide transporter, POT family